MTLPESRHSNMSTTLPRAAKFHHANGDIGSSIWKNRSLDDLSVSKNSAHYKRMLFAQKSATTDQQYKAPPKPPRRDLVFVAHFRNLVPSKSLGLVLASGTLDPALWGQVVKGRGLVFQRRGNGECILVSEVSAGSVAALDGRVHKGDEVLAINGHTMSDVSLETAK